MATAITALAQFTATTNTASITFSSIGQGYRDLMLVITPIISSTPTSVGTYFRINGSSTGNLYSRVSIQGNGSSTSSYSATTENEGYGMNPTDSAISTTTYHFLDYSATDKHKTWLSRFSSTGSDVYVQAYCGRWASTSAITSMTFYAPDYGFGGADYFSAGTTFMLYGVSA